MFRGRRPIPPSETRRRRTTTVTRGSFSSSITLGSDRSLLPWLVVTSPLHRVTRRTSDTSERHGNRGWAPSHAGRGDQPAVPWSEGGDSSLSFLITSLRQARPKGAADPTRWRGGDGRGHHTNLWLTSERLGWWWRLFPRIVLHSLWSFRSETRLRDEQRDGHHFQHFSSFILVSHGKRKEMLKVILYYIIITKGERSEPAEGSRVLRFHLSDHSTLPRERSGFREQREA